MVQAWNLGTVQIFNQDESKTCVQFYDTTRDEIDSKMKIENDNNRNTALYWYHSLDDKLLKLESKRGRKRKIEDTNTKTKQKKIKIANKTIC